jgi:chromosome segregation ATPase
MNAMNDSSTLLLSWHDSQNHTLAQVHSLTDMYDDLMEAVDGLSWQQDRKKAELAVAEEGFREIAEQREKCLHTLEHDDTLSSQIHCNQTMADAAMTQLHMDSIQQQIDYLDDQITRTLAKVAKIREEIDQQRKGLRYRRSIAV